MTKIERSSTCEEIKTMRGRTVALALAFSAAALAASAVSHAKPAPGSPLNAAVCKTLNGVWTTNACTIPEGTSAVATTSFKIGSGVTLDVRGGLTINDGVTIANSGAIVVENAGGVAPGMFHDWETGILVFGTLANAGSLTVANVYDGANATPQPTEGITVSFSVTGDPADPSSYVVAAGTLTNSGTITIQNTAQTRGIKNIGTFVNATSGNIAVANSGTSSIGIYLRREKLSPDNQFYAVGTLTNDGRITIQSSGDSNSGAQYGYGIYNVSFFTNSASGTFTINPSPAADDAGGFYNKGTFTNFGMFVNDRGNLDEVDQAKSTWGSFNELSGTMLNYGTTNVATQTAGTGTFYNDSQMINLGKIVSHGFLIDLSSSLNGSTMINYGTIYNFGGIGGGVNKGVCIDEPAADGNPPGGGCG